MEDREAKLNTKVIGNLKKKEKQITKVNVVMSDIPEREKIKTLHNNTTKIFDDFSPYSRQIVTEKK